MHALFALLLLFAQASPESERLWQEGQRLAALERMAAELAERPDEAGLRTLLVRRELEAARFRAALDHSQGLPAAELGLRGRALYFLTRYEEALEHLRLDDRGELLMRAEALRALGRLDEVQRLLPRLREVLGGEHAQVRLIEARGLIRKGEVEDALQILRAVLRAHPLEAEALFVLGRALMRQGQREEGLRLLERHRALTPLLDELDFARRGVALAPRGASNLAALGEAWRALMPYDPTAAEEAGRAYADALRFAGPAELTPVALRAARFRREDLGDTAAAIELLEGAITRAEDVRLRVRVADYLAQTGERSRALGHLRKALELRPGDRAILERIAKLEDGERER